MRLSTRTQVLRDIHSLKCTTPPCTASCVSSCFSTKIIVRRQGAWIHPLRSLTALSLLVRPQSLVSLLMLPQEQNAGAPRGHSVGSAHTQKALYNLETPLSTIFQVLYPVKISHYAIRRALYKPHLPFSFPIHPHSRSPAYRPRLSFLLSFSRLALITDSAQLFMRW